MSAGIYHREVRNSREIVERGEISELAKIVDDIAFQKKKKKENLRVYVEKRKDFMNAGTRVHTCRRNFFRTDAAEGKQEGHVNPEHR